MVNSGSKLYLVNRCFKGSKENLLVFLKNNLHEQKKKKAGIFRQNQFLTKLILVLELFIDIFDLTILNLTFQFLQVKCFIGIIDFIRCHLAIWSMRWVNIKF